MALKEKHDANDPMIATALHNLAVVNSDQVYYNTVKISGHQGFLLSLGFSSMEISKERLFGSSCKKCNYIWPFCSIRAVAKNSSQCGGGGGGGQIYLNL
jgi:hypothetical protein